MSKSKPPKRPTGPTLDTGDVALRILHACHLISERSNTAYKNLVDAFLRHVSPSMARNGDTMFPFNVRPHPLHPDRTTHEAAPDVLLAHIGITILAYYDLAQYRGPLNHARYHAKVARAMDRLVLLEAVAQKGLEAFDVVGTPARGYTLKEKETYETSIRNQTHRGTDTDGPARGSGGELHGAVGEPDAGTAAERGTPAGRTAVGAGGEAV